MKANRKLKKPDASSKLILEEIIGLTTKNCNGLASNTSTSKCAYMAGCVVVVYDVDSGIQSHLMVSHRLPKPLCCVAMSRDGRFVAAGESGPQPALLLWDCATMNFICELQGHLYGVECIVFSPDGEHLVSVGGYIYLWNWRSEKLVTKLKANSSCSAITSVSFSSDAKFIVTAGKKHLKFWTIGSSARTRLNKGTESLTMHAKPVSLGFPKGSSFVSVTSATWTDNSVVNHEMADESFAIFALTDAGVLYLIRSGLSVAESVDLKVEKAFGLSASDKLIACACSKGAVLLFTIKTLKYAGTLHYFMPKKCNGESDTVYHTQLAPTLPNAIACQFSTSEKLVVVYGDHSLYIWDINHVNEATRCCVLVSHSACIWDVKNLCCENMHDPSLACVARGCSGGVSFSTCSADGSIRLWDLAFQHGLSNDATDHNYLKIEPVEAARLVSAGIFERDAMETSIGTQGFRSMAVCSEGKYLAAGDNEGNLHIYDLETFDYTCFKDVHDGEILSLSFSLSSKNDFISEDVIDSHQFLVSGGRDRTIHLYDVERNFELVESIDDHSAAVTSVKFTRKGSKILSCSADRSLVFRDVAVTGSAYKISRRHQQLASHGTVYDMVIDPTLEVAVTVGQDKKINSFDIAEGKLIRSLKQYKDFGEPIKVTMDPSGSYLVCSYSNKSICMYDFISGELLAQALGHGEVITGVIFLPDCKHIVSVGGDGCIFLWRLPARFTSRMLRRVKECSGVLSPRNLAEPVALSQIMFCEEEHHKCEINTKDLPLVENTNRIGRPLRYEDGKTQETSAFRFSISRLPKWAQTKVTSSDSEFSSSQQVEQKIFSPMVGEDGNYGSSIPEVQTPSNYGLANSKSCLSSLSRSSPDASKSRSSLLPQEAVRSFALDKRWRSVYTVCLDLISSPEVLSLKELKMPLSFPNLFQEPIKPLGDGEGSSRHDSHEPGTPTNQHASPTSIGFLGKDNNQFNQQNSSACDEIVADVAGQLHSDRSEGQENVDINICHTVCEDSDLFKQHFGSLSSTYKVEKKISTVRRRFSSQYVVRRDYDGGCNRLFNTPVRNSGLNFLMCREESATKSTLDNLAVKDSFKKDFNDPAEEEGNEVLEGISECKKALLNLDRAAESVVQLFSKLGTLISSEEFSSGPGAQLCNEAAELLPSIAEKLNAAAKAVQHRNNDLCGRSIMEFSGFEPLLGTFAQSLSQKVVEILKNNPNAV